MRTLLQLHPHKHTGKLLHHRHTSYRALFLLLALTGAILITPAGMAKASDYRVDAVVPAPLPSQSAVITHPVNGSSIRTSTVAIGGTCPVVTPAIIVVLYEGSEILGSQACTQNGTFDMSVMFEPGSHTVIAQIVSFTGQVGASSEPVTFTYQPVTITYVTTSTPTSTATPLTIVSDAPFIVFGMAKDAVWNVTFKGGSAPYSASVHWGDGTVQNFSKLNAGQYSFKHHYSKMRSYKIRIDLKDSTGATTNRGITAVTPLSYGGSINSLGTTKLPLTWLLYVLYILTILLLIMFWRRERLHYAHAVIPVTAAKRRKPVAKKRR